MIPILITMAAIAGTAIEYPQQPANLSPRETENGVVFQCYAPHTEHVYLAGEFNDWAYNRGGYITDNQYAMHGPDTNGVFERTVRLNPGVYSYKFCIDGKPNGWFTPSNSRHLDGDGNALVIVDGTVDEDANFTAARPPFGEGNTYTFELHAPAAYIVFLAGDFNNWADNNKGWVHDHRFAMTGPDVDGIWRKTVKLLPGTYQYQFVLNGTNWIANPLVQETDGQQHTKLEVP